MSGSFGANSLMINPSSEVNRTVTSSQEDISKLLRTV